MGQVVEESVKAGLSEDDALCWTKWVFGVKRFVTGLR